MSAMTPAMSSDAARLARREAMLRRGIQAAQAQFDPTRNLIYTTAAADPNVRTYRQSASLPLALALLRQDDAAAKAQAIAIVEAVLESQERSPHHPHIGNWLWLADDAEVADINAVQFVLRGLLPLLMRYEHLLPATLVETCRERVRLALAEEERIDVAPTYSNIHLMSLLALNVGGQWLGDAHFLALGKSRWTRWIDFTLQAGAPHEYNSPTYGAINLMSLALLHELVADPEIRLQARLMYERFWLHVSLHLHQPTHQLAGPHCRCYWWPMQSGRNPVKDLLWSETGWDWLLLPGPYGGNAEPPISLELLETQHWLPPYITTWLQRQAQAMPYEVRETANRDEGFDLTSYFSPSYTFGTASRTYGIGTNCFYIEHQANYLLLYYTRPQDTDSQENGGWGMVYSRYVVNNRHWGMLGAAPDRPKDANFYDQGNFAGVQLHNKAIALYALEPQHEEVFSLKTVVAFPTGKALAEVWINDQLVDLNQDLPQLQPGDWLIAADGGVYVGVYVLEQSCLGREAPIQLAWGPLDELWLVIYNYRGGAIRFWDYASLGGAFWRGNLRAGFVMEVAERSEYPDAAAFLAHLRAATITDTVDDNHIRQISYSSGGEKLALRYDLWCTQPVERLLNDQSYIAPNLQAPLAVQGASGHLTIGRATLITNPQPVWLIAQELDPTSRTWIAVNPTATPTPLRLETPRGVITAERWGMGRLEWQAPEEGEERLLVEGLTNFEGLTVPAGLRMIEVT